MATLRLSEAQIRHESSPEIFRRGEEYERRGAVVALVRRGDRLSAAVEGSEPDPYRVEVRFDEAGVRDAACSCPYEWGGWCKHVVAALLVCLHDPDAIEERPTVEELLVELDRDRLRALVLELVEREPALADAVERSLEQQRVASAEGTDPAADRPPTVVALAAVRRDARDALYGRGPSTSWETSWHVGRGAPDEAVVDRALAAIAAGDGRAALAILGAVTDEYVAAWQPDDWFVEEADDLFAPLGAAWAEVVVAADLPAEEREEWGEKLEQWADDLADYGFEEIFEPALAALGRTWGGAATDDYAEDVTNARLNVLERQGRLNEFLEVAREAGMVERRATMLVRLDRVEEAVAEALAGLTTADGAFAVARALCERGEVERALEVAERGLALDGEKADLAGWLRDLALGLGERARALPAALTAFAETPDLGSFLGVREAEDEAAWPARRKTLLANLRRRRTADPRGRVEIFLHEGLTGDAIAAVKGSHDDGLVARVAEAAIETDPDWVIPTAQAHAVAIIERGRADAYDEAVDWLSKAGEASRAADREDDWRTYLDDLIVRHHRKYKLRPMLEALRG
jgi:uncharacterized Zn finger protein